MTAFNAELKGGFVNIVGGKRSTDKSNLWGC